MEISDADILEQLSVVDTTKLFESQNSVCIGTINRMTHRPVTGRGNQPAIAVTERAAMDLKRITVALGNTTAAIGRIHIDIAVAGIEQVDHRARLTIIDLQTNLGAVKWPVNPGRTGQTTKLGIETRY